MTERTVPDDILDELFAVIQSRQESMPEGSYTAELLGHEKGRNAILEKLGEETTELILAAAQDDPDAVASESADLVYHLLVLLVALDLDLDALRSELRKRR